jgi:hypothetical protein
MLVASCSYWFRAIYLSIMKFDRFGAPHPPPGELKILCTVLSSARPGIASSKKCPAKRGTLVTYEAADVLLASAALVDVDDLRRVLG